MLYACSIYTVYMLNIKVTCMYAAWMWYVCSMYAVCMEHVCCMHAAYSGVGNAAAAAAKAATLFRPRLCGKASSEPYNSASIGKGSTTPVIE